ncbi:hypothetical protein SBOR_5561 [Sclerotinia borealis F-4128]|uniref:Uncharacterized protein n=1 Tax=Sclerotinia borealis (strain F-4128) TaxID=1432307 RepID=W9CHL6_SCLBF|nr:hypothetical protein SBOR_5561 [Sclerotinia borealis F-4128]
MPEAEQTTDGDYEFLDDYTFEAVNYERYMSWKKGDGHVILGIRKLKADSNEENGIVHPGWSVKVKNVDFKLVKTITY